MNYHGVNYNLSLTDFDLLNVDESNIYNYLRLLPELGKEGYINVERNSSYYIFHSEWDELGDGNNFYAP